MKTKDIQRGIESPLRRKSGDSPRLGQVARLRRSHVSTGVRSGRSGRRLGNGVDPERRKRVLAWSAVLGLASLVVIGLTISMWLVPQLGRRSAKREGDPAAHEAAVRVASKFPSPSREEALERVRLALANRDPAKIDLFFRKGGASGSRILEFLNGMEAKDGPIERYDWLSSMDQDGLLVDGVLVVAKGRDRPVERIAFLTPDAAGEWKLDFDAFARTVSPSWEELLVKGADHAVVRVFVGKDVYYNGPFEDEGQWVCYGMVSPDTEELLRGYCRVGSKEAEALKRLFAEGQKMGRATLEIHRVKDGEARQFEITRVLAKDWILTEAPDSGS
jgi:hypothetical protein